MRGPTLLLLSCLCVGLCAAPVRAENRHEEALILRAWDRASPCERRVMRETLAEVEATYRFADARPLLVSFEERLWSLEELFLAVLEPALGIAPRPEGEESLGLLEPHRRALAALAALRSAFSAPRAVTTGTLNLFLGYAHEALSSPALQPAARLRFLAEALRNVRSLDGRAEPDARTRWLVSARLLPLLLGLALLGPDEGVPRELISEAASLLYLPSLLSAQSQAQLAPLTDGLHAREILTRAYREGTLDAHGLIALARTVALNAADDAAFASASPPLLLQLVCDARIPAPERAALLETVRRRLAPLAPLRGMARDLLASVHDGPPRPLDQYMEGSVLPAEPSRGGRWRFLQVVLLRSEPDRPLSIARVTRADLPARTPILEGRDFLGVIVPAEDGEHVDFLGPPPGLGGARDHRLLRRTLRLERIAITSFGARGEEIELCVALPEDAREPVPLLGAGLGHVLALVQARLDRAPDMEQEERRDLVRLLVKIGTEGARGLAVTAAAGGLPAMELLPLLDDGDPAAAGPLLDALAALPLDAAERVVAATVRTRDPALLARVRDLCRGESVAAAVLAADALLGNGDATGVEALLEHPSAYARAAATSLALLLTETAGSLRILPGDAALVARVLDRAGKAFTLEADGKLFADYGGWLREVIADPEAARRKRRDQASLRIDGRTVSPSEFARAWAAHVRGGENEKIWANLARFLLVPEAPGRGIPESALGDLLDALEARALEHEGELHDYWRDSLILLACAQQSMEADAQFLDLARRRLERLAGDASPSGAQRKPGIFWPIWAASRP